MIPKVKSPPYVSFLDGLALASEDLPTVLEHKLPCSFPHHLFDVLVDILHASVVTIEIFYYLGDAEISLLCKCVVFVLLRGYIIRYIERRPSYPAFSYDGRICH
jgi:hypothetical protein